MMCKMSTCSPEAASRGVHCSPRVRVPSSKSRTACKWSPSGCPSTVSNKSQLSIVGAACWRPTVSRLVWTQKWNKLKKFWYFADCASQYIYLNLLTPNDPYMGRTAPLTSKRCILYIYSTNTGTEYFKHALYSPSFFSSKCSLFDNANLFGSCIIHILYTGCAKIKKK